MAGPKAAEAHGSDAGGECRLAIKKKTAIGLVLVTAPGLNKHTMKSPNVSGCFN